MEGFLFCVGISYFMTHYNIGGESMKALKYLVLTGMTMAAVLGGNVGARAADGVYELNPILVTAQRTASEDLKTPAAVEVLTADELQKTGATSMQEALKFSTGLITHAQGPRNISQGTMTSKVVIRGVEKGTLVLVDGVPMNQSGRYNLEDIPVDIVDRVEVVRGGGAVLYGSEANGGVINIITKGKRANMVRLGVGNYGIQNYAASAQAGKLGVSASYDHTGKIDNISDPSGGKPTKGLYYNIIRGEHSNFNARYDFNDKLFLSHTYGRNSDHYVYRWDGRAFSTYPARNPGADYKHVIHTTEENITTLHYDDGAFKANVFYNRKDQNTKNSKAKNYPYNEKYKSTDLLPTDNTAYLDQTFGLDVSNRWQFDKGSFMVGYSFVRELENVNQSEVYSSKSTTPGYYASYTRNIHSIYGQLAYDFTKATRANFNFRETMTEADAQGNNKIHKFTPEVILMHDLDDKTMLYAKVGKSFMLPTFSQLYGGGNIHGNEDLKPSNGNHYELGLKKNIGQNAWRLALYQYKIKDSIEADDSKWPDITYKNEDVKNRGIELDWTRQQSENFSYHLGLAFSHPQKKETKTTIKEGKVDVNPGNWHDYYSKFGFNGGLDYTHGKLTTAFQFNYVGKRIRDVSPYASLKAQCFSDLNLSYQANSEARFFLNIDNIFNRHDIVSSSSSSYYNLGRNFMAGMEYKF